MGDKLKFSYTPGPVVRRIGDYEWSPRTGWTQAVDLETAANLLAYPRGGFKLAERPTAKQRQALADLLGVWPENIVVPKEEATAVIVPPLESVVRAPGRAEQLAAEGVTTLAALEGLSEDDVRRLAEKTGASVDEINDWVAKVK